jgi:hypothetical protein
MTLPTATPPVRPGTARELLIQQQRTTDGELPRPRLLRTPSIVLLWAITLTTVVAALALGRVRVPNTVRGVVVAARSPAGHLTPLLIIPESARRFVKPGQAAAVDTGGTDALTLTITSVEPHPLDRASARRRLAVPPNALTSLRIASVAAHLSACADGRCLPLTAGTSYAATAALGTRSLASYAIPGS